MIRCYEDLIRLPSFEERYAYLDLCSVVGATTFGADRYLNQILYRSNLWKTIRREVIIRDNGCDLADPDYTIFDCVCVHHMNPITIEDVLENNPDIFNIRYLITTSVNTHKAIHFGSKDMLSKIPIERYAYDTAPWRK